MQKQQQNQPESQLLSLLDNLDFKQQLQGTEYITLIKKQPQKNYSTLYLNDCEDNFWLKKVDIPFIQSLKNQLNLKTSTHKFIECLMKGLKENCHIIIPQDNPISDSSQTYPYLSIKLQIGQGLTMTTQIKLNRNVNRQQDQTGHKIILKLFLVQLYESKQSKQKSLQKQLQLIKQKKQQEESQAHSHNNNNNNNNPKDNKFMKEMFSHSEEKKDPMKNLKNRDLLNPNKQKRKHAGVKLTTPNN